VQNSQKFDTHEKYKFTVVQLFLWQIFRSGTDLISLLILLFFFLLGRPSSKNPKAPSGMKFDGVVLQVNIHKLTESDFGCHTFNMAAIHDVISHRSATIW